MDDMDWESLTAYNFYGVPQVTTLRIGNLQNDMNETYLNRCFCQFPEYLSAKVICNKQTGQSEGYGFLRIRSRAGAEQILQSCNGARMPDSDRSFDLSLGEEEDNSPDFTIYVEGLDPLVTDSILKDKFKSTYPSVKSATVVRNETGHSEGYGFVVFKDEKEQERAAVDMHGEEILSGKITTETYKREQPARSQSAASYYQNPQWIPGETDPNNTTLYVGGFDSNVTTTEDLTRVFSHFGEVVNAVIKPRKTHGFGFVQFSDRSSAERALSLHRTQLGGRKIKVTWAARSFQSQQ